MEKCNLTQVPCRKAIMDVVQANKDRRSLQHTVPMVVAQRNVRRMSSGSVRKLRQVCIIPTKI